MDDQQKSFDFKGLFRRRKKGFILLFSLVFIIAVIVAIVLPPIYLSQTTILIEEQQIPQAYIQTTVTSYAEERLQIITQQVMSRTKLLEIINRFNLYQDLQDSATTEEIVEKMREDIKLETISAEVVDRRTGRPTTATVAFTLSFEGKHPGVVQKVANVLASLYLEENVKTRAQRASTTTDFFNAELEKIRAEIEDLEKRISDFKAKHIGELPEYNAINLQALERLNRDLDQLHMQVRSLQERKTYLEGQLSAVDPQAPLVSDNGKTVMNPTDRLKYLRLQLVSMRANRSDKHPDVVRLMNEIKELERETGGGDNTRELLARLRSLQSELTALTTKYGDKHPDVIKKTREIDAVNRDLKRARSRRYSSAAALRSPDNPAYINLKTQLAQTEIELASMVEQAKAIQLKVQDYQKKVERAPFVEREYSTLLRDYETAKTRYNDLMTKYMEARAAQGMEESQRGERFTIVEPAQLPEKPYKPNRALIVAIGLILALGLGGGFAAARESLDQTIKTPSELGELTGLPLLVTLPYLETKSDRRRSKMRIIGLAILVIVLIIAVLVFVHFFVTPLDILWIKIQRRAMMWL